MDGCGAHAFWGTIPAIDLVQLLADSSSLDPVSEEPLNLLVVGTADIRHTLKTISSLRRHQIGRKVNVSDKRLHTKMLLNVQIYLFDNPIDCLARNLLLLSVVTDWSVPIRTRTNSFLEIFGNCLVQERTDKYISRLSQSLVGFVCNGTGPLGRLVDLSRLKHRETDALETIFKNWGKSCDYDMKEFRDNRLRGMYEQRYDTRKGIIDWDYQNAIKPHAGIIHYSQYRHWRETGVGFEFGDQTYTLSNKTMVTYAEGRERGESKLKLGFWGDVVVGPYFAFGVNCDKPNQHAQDIFKVINPGTATEQYRNTAVHVSVYNVLSMIHEIEMAEQYKMTKSQDIFSGLGSELSDSSDENKKKFAMSCAHSVVQLKDMVSIVPLTGKDFFRVFGKFKQHFDMLMISSMAANVFPNPNLSQLLRPGAVIAVETVQNMVKLPMDKKDLYKEKIKTSASSLGFQHISDYPEIIIFKR